MSGYRFPGRRLEALRLAAVPLLLALAGASVPEAPPDGGGDGERLLRQGFYEEAAAAFAARLEKDPEDEGSWRGWAESLDARGRYAEALEVLARSPERETSASLLCAAGRIWLRTGKLAEAERSFRRALAVEPANVEALNQLGWVLHRRGQKDEAERQWQRVVSIYEEWSAADVEKQTARVFVEIARALVGLNRYDEANDPMFYYAQERDPKSPALLLEYGKTLLEKYNFRDAPELFREALDQNPYFADARVAMADYYLTNFQVGTKRYDLAEKEIERALKVNPNHAGAYTQSGRLWLADGELGRAREDLEKALEIDPSLLETRGLLAAVYVVAADDEAFSTQEKAALAVNPHAAEFYHTIATAVETKYRYAEARRLCEQALAVDPDYWRAYHTYGINCLRTGEEERGREFLAKSFKEDPYNVWVNNTLSLLRHMDANHREHRTEHFRFKFPKADYEILKTHLAPLLEDAYDRLSRRYRSELKPPIQVDVYSKHKWFSARIVGLEGFPASGACFGNVVALTTPKALPQNWGAVAWHEFTHVVTLNLTENRVPRWLTEGLSVYEEGRDHPRWARLFEREVADAFVSGRLLKIEELSSGFSKPRYPGQVLMSYFQGCLIVEYIVERWSFDRVLEILRGYRDKKTTAHIFRDVLGVSLDELDQGFFAFLAGWVEKTGYQPEPGPEVIPRLQLQVEEKPEDVKLLCDLAWVYLVNGNEIDAPITVERALKLDPDCADALAVRGFIRLREGKTAPARQDLEAALEKGSRFRFRLHAALGELAAKEKDRDGAIRHFEEARKISPRAGAGHPPRGNLYYRLAKLYDEKGDGARARERLEDLRAFAVEDGECRMRLVKEYLVEDTDEAARKAFEILEELFYLNPFDRSLHENLARVAARLGEHRVAVREYTYLLTYPDTNPLVAYLALARAHLALGEKEEAVRYAGKVLEIDRDHEEARRLLEEAGGGAAESGEREEREEREESEE